MLVKCSRRADEFYGLTFPHRLGVRQSGSEVALFVKRMYVSS